MAQRSDHNVLEILATNQHVSNGFMYIVSVQRSKLTCTQLDANQIHFIDYQYGNHMLDDWMERPSTKQEYSKSILSEEMIIRHSLKERILELEKMRDQILYELARLQEITQDKKL